MKGVKIKWIKERATESSSFSERERERISPRSESLNNYIHVPLSEEVRRKGVKLRA